MALTKTTPTPEWTISPVVIVLLAHRHVVVIAWVHAVIRLAIPRQGIHDFNDVRHCPLPTLISSKQSETCGSEACGMTYTMCLVWGRSVRKVSPPLAKQNGMIIWADRPFTFTRLFIPDYLHDGPYEMSSSQFLCWISTSRSRCCLERESKCFCNATRSTVFTNLISLRLYRDMLLLPAAPITCW